MHSAYYGFEVVGGKTGGGALRGSQPWTGRVNAGFSRLRLRTTCHHLLFQVLLSGRGNKSEVRDAHDAVDSCVDDDFTKVGVFRTSESPQGVFFASLSYGGTRYAYYHFGYADPVMLRRTSRCYIPACNLEY